METTKVLSVRAAGDDADAQFRLGFRFAFCRHRARRNPRKAFTLGGATVCGKTCALPQGGSARRPRLGSTRLRAISGYCLHEGRGEVLLRRAARRGHVQARVIVDEIGNA